MGEDLVDWTDPSLITLDVIFLLVYNHVSLIQDQWYLPEWGLCMNE